MSKSFCAIHPLALAIIQTTLATGALAQAGGKDAETIEEVVVTGTRKEGLSPTETLSPVDVLGGADLANQAAFDMTDGLSKVAPSINTQRFPIADGTAFIRPVTLRNLSPDQTLVLVNGTRRHRSALVNLQLAPLGTVNQGAQAVDYSTLPAAAIKRVEVLRDGASAQYGSDAIAGVINVILKDANEGLSLSTQYGEYNEGDGERFTISANAGFPLGDNGFLNATIEHSTSDTTSRGNARPDAMEVEAFVGPGLVPFDGLGQRWGDPDVEATKFFVNTGIEINNNAELYAFGSYMDNETISDFVYRIPALDAAAMVEAEGTLQVDGNGDFIPDDAPQSLVDDILASGLTPSDYLVADADSPSGFVLRNPIFTMFPGGYNPDFGADITDYAVVIGAKGETNDGFSWDIRGRTAENEVEYTLSETINGSLGQTSPTSFKPGTLTQEEVSLNADFVKPVDVNGLSSPLNIAFGLEYREETYEIEEGDPASRNLGPVLDFGVGSDGFQGFPVESAGEFESESFAGYLDLEADITDIFSAGFALRYEDYDEFGETIDWKLSARLEVADGLALRATANTGFRAPTPGQANTLNITTTADATGNLIPNGTYPVEHPISVVLGSQPLDPEESSSFTLGVVFTAWENTNITIDYYDIKIEDRIALQNNTIEAGDVPLLIDAGVANAALLEGSNANFFVNAFESNVKGVDLSITHAIDLRTGSVTLDFRHNFNEQEVEDVAPGTINASRVFDLENQVPENRSTFSVNYDTGEWFSGYVRVNYYDEWKTTSGLFSPGDASDVQPYDSEVLVDVELTLNYQNKYSVSFGSENVFDVEPDDEQTLFLRGWGADKSLTSPFGFNGAFWYIRASAHF